MPQSRCSTSCWNQTPSCLAIPSINITKTKTRSIYKIKTFGWPSQLKAISTKYKSLTPGMLSWSCEVSASLTVRIMRKCLTIITVLKKITNNSTQSITALKINSGKSKKIRIEAWSVLIILMIYTSKDSSQMMIINALSLLWLHVIISTKKMGTRRIS